MTAGMTDTRTTLTPELAESVLLVCVSGIEATFAIAVGLVGFATVRGFISPSKRLHGQGDRKASGSAE